MEDWEKINSQAQKLTEYCTIFGKLDASSKEASKEIRESYTSNNRLTDDKLTSENLSYFQNAYKHLDVIMESMGKTCANMTTLLTSSLKPTIDKLYNATITKRLRLKHEFEKEYKLYETKYKKIETKKK